jgi:hypothetical protein
MNRTRAPREGATYSVTHPSIVIVRAVVELIAPATAVIPTFLPEGGLALILVNALMYARRTSSAEDGPSVDPVARSTREEGAAMTRIKIRFGLGTVAALAASFACSSSGSAGDAGSCLGSLLGSSCYSCVEGSCRSQLSSVTSACSALIDCACPGGVLSCSAAESMTCSQLAMESSCASAGKTFDACMQQSCANQCGSYIPCADAGGGVMVSTCSGFVTADACSVESCTATGNGTTSCYYQVGVKEFPCTSCSDTTSCQQAAMAACN